MRNRCKANPCCGEPDSCEMPVQDVTGLVPDGHAPPPADGLDLLRAYVFGEIPQDVVVVSGSFPTPAPAPAPEEKRPKYIVYDWVYWDRGGKRCFAGTPEKAERLAAAGEKLTTLYTMAED